MATAGNLIIIAAVASICMYGGCSTEVPYDSLYVRDVQSSNTYSDPDHKVIAHLKRVLYINGGNNYQQHQTQVVTQISHSGSNTQTLHEFCSKYQEYNTLLQLKDSNSCLRATDVWPLLESLSQHEHPAFEGPKCRVQVIHLLSAAFGNIDKNPDYCLCHGHVDVSHFPNIEYTTFQNCWGNGNSENNYYQKLYHEYYSGHSYGIQRTHHHIWHPLNQITDFRCQRNLVMNLAHTFNNYHPAFGCNQVSSVQPSTHQVESTTATTTPSHTPETTMTDTPKTTQTIVIQTCDKYATITNLAHGTIFSHPAASDCSQGDHRASEALVFQLCHTNETHSWIKGASVLDNCSHIPLYAPVATFIQDSFIPNGGQAGIFVGCLPNGFKLATQECFSNSTVLHIEKGGLYTRDPSIYHVVLF